MKLEKLRDEMASVGYVVDSLQTDGQYHRFKVGKSKGTPGYYKIINIGSGLVAVYGDFVGGQRFTWTAGSDNGQLSAEGVEVLKKRIAEEERKIEREHEKGAMAACFFWDTGEEIFTHEYLRKKKVKSHGLKICTLGPYKNWLMVPGYNSDKDIRTINYINADGEKRFEASAEKKGTFFSIPGNGKKIIICEGYSTGATIHQDTGHTVIVSFDAGNLFPVSKIIREKNRETEIVIAADNDQWKPEIGNTGVDAGTNAAIEIDAKLTIPKFKDLTTRPTDFNDLSNLEGPQAVSDQIEAARPVDKVQALKIEVNKLLGLDPIEREFERDRLAEKYKVRKSIIDDHLAQLSKQSQDDSAKSVVDTIQPAADPVNGGSLVNTVFDILSKRVILPDGAADAISLWVLLTYCHNAFNVLPLLGITSPTKRCGKTTLIEILQALTDKGLAASNLTPAAAFRTIEKYSPTLLIDEADTFLKNNDELRGIINSGHTKSSAFVIRVEGDNHEPVKLSTWGPKAIGMIGTLPDTIEDRSIVIQLRRKMPGETVVKTGLNFIDESAGIRAQCKRWCQDNFDNICNVEVSVAPSGNDRADDNWHPLFAIAEVVGGSWPGKVKAAMTKLVALTDDDVTGAKLLIDIRDIFELTGNDRIFSNDLVDELKALTESPWGDWSRGKGLSANGMGRLLKPFGIKSKNVRIEEEQYKGYTLDSFQDAFNRYIPRDLSVPPSQCNDFKNLDENPSVPSIIDETDEKHGKQLNLLDWDSGTAEKQDMRNLEENNLCRGCGACDSTTGMCHAKGYFDGKPGSGIPCKDAIKICEYNKE